MREKRIEYNFNHTQKNNKTGYPGIIYINNKYRARINYNHNSIHLGYFDTLSQAIKARKEAEKKYFPAIFDKSYIKKQKTE